MLPGITNPLECKLKENTGSSSLVRTRSKISDFQNSFLSREISLPGPDEPVKVLAMLYQYL